MNEITPENPNVRFILNESDENVKFIFLPSEMEQKKNDKYNLAKKLLEERWTFDIRD